MKGFISYYVSYSGRNCPVREAFTKTEAALTSGADDLQIHEQALAGEELFAQR
jgi:hypothetical protein